MKLLNQREIIDLTNTVQQLQTVEKGPPGKGRAEVSGGGLGSNDSG